MVSHYVESWPGELRQGLSLSTHGFNGVPAAAATTGVLVLSRGANSNGDDPLHTTAQVRKAASHRSVFVHFCNNEAYARGVVPYQDTQHGSL
jgi:hypothetical protein